MSKKKNKKFKKSHKHQAQSVHPTGMNLGSVAIENPAVLETPVHAGAAGNGEPKVDETFTKEAAADDPQFSRIRKDVKKITMIMAVMAAILIGIYFLNKQTTLLEGLGDWLYRVGNIQVQ